MNAHSYPRQKILRSLDDIQGKKVTVMGVGLNKGGEETIRFFLKHGAFVTATDTKTREQLLPTIDSLCSDPSLDTSRLRFALGGHDLNDFKTADIVIKNPVIKFEGNEFLKNSRVVETDISIFLSLAQPQIIAVTGSKGKSTTAGAIHYGLTEAGFDALLGGNITVSPLSFLEQATLKTLVVLELSSWQLRDLRGRGLLKPKIALITTIVSDHQNWYNNMQDYVDDKKLIYADQDSSDWTICASDSWGDIFASETRASVMRYDAQKIMQKNDSFIGDLFVPGAHNKLNIHIASLALGIMGISKEKCGTLFSRWRGLPHRLEYFHTWNNGDTAALFYNDTTATVPESAAAASQAFEKPVHLITGGTDKSLDFNVLAQTLKDGIKPASVYLLGGSATEKLIPLLHERGIFFSGPFNSLDSLLVELKTRLASAKNTAAHSEVVVFSPGATSFGMFKNEFDRGDIFKQKAREYFP
jgi:UDP-N-acetylmuramoylalanine--D-glutamate ligase